MEQLYDYVFHYNPYEENWSAIPRDKYLDYWSKKNVEGVLKSKNYNTLIAVVLKGKHFIDELNNQ